jgi:murein DD-endopeptidase MepM/ murein hydrolase activator NlpD
MEPRYVKGTGIPKWHWPLTKRPELPRGKHQGAFGAVRKYDVHTGVDLYCSQGDIAFAVEPGVVIAVEIFTGPNADSPWWNETYAVLVRGKYTVLYGELEYAPFARVGDGVLAGEPIGRVGTVLKKDKGLPMTMLHLEMYRNGAAHSVWWRKGQPRPRGLMNPTLPLLHARKG